MTTETRPLPLAILCAAELSDGDLCADLLGACPDHPVCSQRHPFDPSTRCLRQSCSGQHDPTGEVPWAETEESPMNTTTRGPVLDEWEQDAMASELEQLRAENADLDDRIGSVRDGVMQAIYDAGVHEQVCDDDSVPDMVRAALRAVTEGAS